ncbi:quercetin dioxygenase-like cupin family protein [Pseudomonas corrugata]|uniref:cupin domain-containing protein n=1 Tax=Pseudomonas corrugata TaxID=47879 RepID=UPI002861CE01|nr:cupin domain-containing protein [Pseudomonas corrugata]MDR7286100.1 quercetin dioxygenase-like cupin family protein [Pseudomonas corrugata]
MSNHLLVNTRFTTVLMASLSLVAGAMHASMSVAAESQIEVTQLLKTTQSWDGAQYRKYPEGQPEVSVLRYKIPAHSSLPWHTHPVVNVAYVISGHLTVIRKDNGKSLLIGPGDVLPEIVGAFHRGESGDEPVELIVFYAGTPTVALTVKAEP